MNERYKKYYVPGGSMLHVYFAWRKSALLYFREIVLPIERKFMFEGNLSCPGIEDDVLL